jgi:hypothetical protein
LEERLVDLHNTFKTIQQKTMGNRIKITLLALLISVGAQAQKLLSLKITQGENKVYCGATLVALHVTKKEIKVFSEHGELDLKVTKRRGVDEYGSYRAKDKNGNLYTISSIQEVDGPGKGLLFAPDKTYMQTFTIANVDICE